MLNFIRNCIEEEGQPLFVTGSYDAIMTINKNNLTISSWMNIKWIREKGPAYIFHHGEQVLVAGTACPQVVICQNKFGANECFIYEENVFCKYVCLIGDNIWFFPKNLRDGIIKFDVLRKNFIKEKNIYNSELESLKFTYGNSYRDLVYLNDMRTKELIEINIKKRESRIIKLPIEDTIFSVTLIKNLLYLTSATTSKVYILNLKYELIGDYSCEKTDKPFAKPIEAREGLILCNDDQLFYFENGHYYEIQCPPEVKGKNSWFLTSFDFDIDKKIVLLPWTSKYIVEIDTEKKVITSYKKCKTASDGMICKKIIHETQYGDMLIDFLEEVCK
ncbi:hypothetical protein [Pseudobutyrivibrio sp. LB2011]|uniref:hypothetical protein n=1 Tax=Pseudobutyrivibrio sp. LB2011 TaxID=1408312 RepID=UPI0005D1E204|nr:hypothetical protein [Pseudobutyrivibrio sp. LB2011]